MDLKISAETVSRLVLGHLRSEKSRSTYREYLNSCPHFRNVTSPTNRTKLITTRLRGLSLCEVLQEYAAVDNLVQEYLEALGYFRNHKKTCLLDEVDYLLTLTGAKFEGNRSRSSTPLRQRSVSPLMHPNNHNQLSPIVESSFIESEVNTTALQDLPGNSGSFKETSKNAGSSSSKETTTLLSKADCIGQDDHMVSPAKSTNSTTIDCSLERIQQTILEHPEFQAKIAENINSIINTSVHSVNKENTVKAVTELDSTIKMILQKTEEDPMFERLLEDLIGDATSVSSLQHNHQSAESTTNNMLHTPKKLSLTSGNTVSIKQRLRSSRKSICGSDTLFIESSNNDVIDKIVTAAAATTATGATINVNSLVVSSASDTTVPTSLTTCQQTTQNQSVASTTSSLSNADIILYDGPIDTLFTQNTSQHSATPGGLLMVQPPTTQTSTFSSSSLVTTPSDVAKSQQQPFYMIADNGDVISLPSQMIVCTSDAATIMQQQQYATAATMAPQQAQTIVLPTTPTGPKFIALTNTAPADDKPQASSLVDLFSSYKPADTPEIPLRRRPSKPREKQMQKRIKTILPMPIYKIDILPVPEDPSLQLQAAADEAVISLRKENLTISHSNASTDLEETPMTLTPEVAAKKTVTPKSGSHVRVLDFNFVTPAKETIEVMKKDNGKNGSKSVKSLFTTPSTSNIKKKADSKSWDASLRQLAIPSKSLPLPIVMKLSSESTQQPAEVPKLEDVKKAAAENLNNTFQETDSIEKALMLDTEDVDEGKVKKSPRKLTKHVVKKSLRIRKKSDSVVNKAAVDAADTLLMLSKPSFVKDDLNLNLNQPEQENTVQLNEVPQGSSTPNETVAATPPSTTKSRIKRKCNIDSSIKQAVTVTRVKEIKSLDILTESGAKLILSPSKLANKRSIVNVDSSVDLTKVIVMHMPALETPVKLNQHNHPQTPNISATPQILTNETPFTKMFNEQMEGVDISAIPTPKLPITPSLNLISPFNLEQSGCFNRPTDYSTSSSYYQPSDSEQNKSLEKQIIEECRRLEGNVNVPPETEAGAKEDEKLEAIAMAMKMVKNSAGIGRKNLNLMNPKVHSSESSSSNSSSSSSDSSSSTSDSDDSDNDSSISLKTIIQESTIYKLRSRTVSPVVENTSEDINAILSKTNFKAELIKVTQTDDVALTQQAQVLKDLEAKRKRTIAKFKGKEVVVSKGVTTRSSKGRLIKPVNNSDDKAKVKEKPTRARAPSKPAPKKAKCSTSRCTKQARKAPAKLQPEQVMLHPLDIVETHLSEHSAASTPVAVMEEHLPLVKKQTQEESQSLLNMILTSAKSGETEIVYKAFAVQKQSRLEEKIDKIKMERDYNSGGGGKKKIPESKVSPDLEAEKLVKGLKQWGIHLVPKAKSNEKTNTEDNNKEKLEASKEKLPIDDKTEVITFDDKVYTDEDIIEVSFDPELGISKGVKKYDLEVLGRKFTSRIFIDELNRDVDISLTVSPFESIFDLASTAERLSTPDNCNNKIKILDQVNIIPQNTESFQNSFTQTLKESNDERCNSEGVDQLNAIRSSTADFLTSTSDEMPKSITEFQMIKDMQAKLDNPGGLTPKGEDDSLYDFALTDAKGVDSPNMLSSKKRTLNDDSVEDRSPKRPKIDHEQLLQELQSSDKKKCSKSANNIIKSKSDRQLLNYEKIDVEHLLSVLHP